MPNYCDNYIQLEGDVNVIRKLVKDNTRKYASWQTNDVEVDSFDLTMMRLTPRVLDQITSGSMQHEGVTLSNWAYRNAEGEFVGQDLENRNDDSLTIVPISIKEGEYPNDTKVLTEEGEKIFAEHGARDWYQWRLDNWGTKWITPTPIDEVHENELINLSNNKESLAIEFANQSAWGPPYELISYICKTYNLRGSCRWHEEGGNADWGHFDNKGELVS